VEAAWLWGVGTEVWETEAGEAAVGGAARVGAAGGTGGGDRGAEGEATGKGVETEAGDAGFVG